MERGYEIGRKTPEAAVRAFGTIALGSGHGDGGIEWLELQALGRQDDIDERIGYESELAFARAFKRE